jgi:RNA polymerase sigma-70 factor, ECF subfamily
VASHRFAVSPGGLAHDGCSTSCYRRTAPWHHANRTRVGSRSCARRCSSRLPVDYQSIRDDQLRLFFICCHPALAIGSQVALALRLLGGLTTAEIAHGFVEAEPTIGKRITRAKAKIKANNLRYRIPTDSELPERLNGVLAAISLIFTAGHHAPIGGELTRVELADEAIRLAELLVALMPDEPECAGLLALLLASSARRDTRTDVYGNFVSLADADRTRWDLDQAEYARALLERAMQRGAPGPFQVQAAISCLHSLALSFESTDWPQIVQLYGVLEAMAPAIAVRVNRAIAVAQVYGPKASLGLLDEVRDAAQNWPFFHVACGSVLVQLERTQEAQDAFTAALRLTHNEVDRRHIEALVNSLAP